MDRRVFQPRPSGNEARRRSALMTAILVLAAGGFWLYAQRTTLPQPAAAPIPVTAGKPPGSQ